MCNSLYKMKKTLTSMFLLFSVVAAAEVIKGTVTDSRGELMPFVTVFSPPVSLPSAAGFVAHHRCYHR